MSRQIAGIDLGAAIQGVFGGDPLTLTQHTEGAAATDPNDAPTQTVTAHPCQGYPQAVQRSKVKDSLVRQRMVVFGIYGNTLPFEVEPLVGNLVTDDGGRVHNVYFVDGDSVQGVWILYTTQTG